MRSRLNADGARRRPESRMEHRGTLEKETISGHRVVHTWQCHEECEQTAHVATVRFRPPRCELAVTERARHRHSAHYEPYHQQQEWRPQAARHARGREEDAHGNDLADDQRRDRRDVELSPQRAGRTHSVAQVGARRPLTKWTMNAITAMTTMRWIAPAAILKTSTQRTQITKSTIANPRNMSASVGRKCSRRRSLEIP